MATSFQKERQRGLILNAAFSFHPKADQDHSLLLGSVKSPFLFSFCHFNQNTAKKGRAVAMRPRKMSWPWRALHLSRGICKVASLQSSVDLQDFVGHLTKMEGFKNRMWDIDAIIFLKIRYSGFVSEISSLKFLSTQQWLPSETILLKGWLVQTA